MSYEGLYDVPMDEIEVSNLNVRVDNPLKDIDELAASIKKHGLIQPVVILGEHGSPPYELIAGQRRFLAHQKLKRATIQAIFAGDLNDEKAVLLSLIENLQSVDLNHADSARAITQLYESYDRNERKVRQETGLSIRRIRDYLTIESQASPKMKRQLQQKLVKPAEVKRALRAARGNIRKAEKLLDLMSACSLTKHQKRRVIEYGEDHTRAPAEKILEEAMKPRVEQSIMVSLPEDVRQGLELATKELSQEAEDIVMEVLQEWLSEQGFIDE